MDDSPLFAGIELGGTKATALIGRDAQVLDSLTVPTHAPAETLGRLGDWLEAMQPPPGYAALGIAAFGPVRIDRAARDYGHVLATPKPGWSGADVAGAVAGRFACPVALDTDVDGAALAEYRWGAGQGCTSLVYLTIGTGVGGGVVVEGHPVHGMLHPEIGHVRLRRAADDTFAGHCPFHGDCIEGLIAGPALAARFGQDPAGVAADDPRRGFVAHDLAELIAMLLLALSPQRIVIGGGAGLGFAGLLPAAIARVPALLADYLPDADAAPLARIVVPAALGSDAGLLGALALAERAAR